jgi:hypothetical protein
VLLCCAVATIILLPLRNTSDAFPPVAFMATLVLFMAPGLLVSCWLLGDDLSSFAHLPVGFVVSTGAFGLLGVPTLILHLSTDAYLLAAGVVLCAFLAIAAWRTSRANPRRGAIREGHVLRSHRRPFVGAIRVVVWGSGFRRDQEGA